jgi:hypothetical protein
MPYRFEVDGDVWTSDDLTLGEQCEIERRLGLKYVLLDPAQEAIPRQAFVVAWLTRRMPYDEAVKAADALTGRQLRVSVVDDDRPIEWHDGIPVLDPKADSDAPETT